VRAVLVVSLVALAPAAALLAGCGGDGTTTLVRAEFVAGANEICAETRARIESEFTAYGTSEARRRAEKGQRSGALTADEVAAKVALRIILPALEDEVDKLRAVGLPDRASDRAEELLEAFDEGVRTAKAHPERAARDGSEAFGEARRLAREFGIESC
jgi:alkanesulfonate monooxygenase SsuD/methylene tetrahydromethanopterin reductase-like flavin-dependent oxidoreductase (luciferase family)